MKKIFLRILSVLLAFQGYAAIQFLTIEQVYASEVPDVVINEVMWMGSSADSADEWIELRNTTNVAIDLAGWKLTHAATSDTTLTIALGIIPADGFFLISNFGEASVNSVLDVVSDIVTTSLALLNSCTQIDLTMPDDTVVDSMGCDGSDYFFPAASTTKHALERNIEIADGTVVGSWHERAIGSANLDGLVTDLATPKFVNDVTPADETATIVSDGLATDINWSESLTEASANWSGFTDPESGLSGSYEVELLDSTDAVIDSATVTTTNHTFSLLALSEGETYRFAVTATNGVNLESLAAESDGFTVDTAIPAPASNLTATDVAGDNGGSLLVKWDASTSIDEISYRVDYQKVGDPTVLSQNVGGLLEVVIDGLENDPVAYDFSVVATDFSGLESNGNPTVQGLAQDNLAPVLNPAKVVVAQNKPGNSDTVTGKSAVSNEMATVMVFDRHPSEPVKTTIASVQTNASLGFNGLSLGDNLYGSFWVQLVDDAGNASAPVKFGNDIVAPNSPTITSAVATCQSERCQVELNWHDNGPDTSYYQVRYGSGINVKSSLPVNGTTLILNIEADGTFQEFAVLAFDQHGNASVNSNAFAASSVPGVVTTAKLINGKLVTATEAIAGSREVIVKDLPLPPVKLVPSAQAADDNGDNKAQVANDQDWLRIAIVVVLLLIVAGGFYSLSRSMQKSESDIPAMPVKKKTSTRPKRAVKANISKKRRRSKGR